MATATPNMTERRHIADRRAQSPSSARTLNAVDWVALVLMIIGGINWGLIGLFGFNLVVALFGETQISGLVYVLVGLASLWGIYTCTKLGSQT
ncbi:MAG TPA: DUF378 domain-containing protein [Methylophilaceae bacterium]|nr:DUF378 domain-containing protein [Methylophilaceae bacterium]